MIIRCKKASASPVRNTLDSNNKSTVLPNRRNFKEENRVEFFAIGKCIEQASVALDFSVHGEAFYAWYLAGKHFKYHAWIHSTWNAWNGCWHSWGATVWMYWRLCSIDKAIKNSQELELLVKIYAERTKCLVNIGEKNFLKYILIPNFITDSCDWPLWKVMELRVQNLMNMRIM